MEETLSELNLTVLANYCILELQRSRRHEPVDGGYCLELFRRAVEQQTDQAWTLLQQCLSETIRLWLRTHPGMSQALQHDSEENYIALTFSRFWQAVQEHPPEFPSLKAVLSYLHATLHGVIIDVLRSYQRRQEISLTPFETPSLHKEAEEPGDQEDDYTWESIESLLPHARERRLAYLLYYCGLKPREIVLRCADEFSDIKEIYRLNHNLVDRLRRNRERLRWLLRVE
ncbi:sigma-70 family RNA polymerase sigma factor [Thermogemmatispora onikobensis]|uniref:sigma-70 family RNA polymerase sigma factor n=1 Tax=Thermogemmatispora onikobensis TaxID=732234 RepID=UPI00085390E8|nr:sigma-70 family RNA polymerase sigma factor [Thermogemmatispora onikobensis]